MAEVQTSRVTALAQEWKSTLGAVQRGDAQLIDLDCKPFVIVLLDGDNTLFCNRYVQAGVAGGIEAAAALRNVIKTQLIQAKRFEEHWEICIRAYINADGLARTYRRCGIVAGEDTFRDFVRGFNKAMSLVELIDAGDDKEAADTRIQKTFEVFYPNQHCKQLVLAVSGDRSYTGFLRPYVSLKGFEDRVSFVEALPFTRDMVDLTTGLLRFRAPKLLRNDKLVVITQSSASEASQSAPSTGTYATAVALPRQTMPAASPMTTGAATPPAYGNTTQAVLPLWTSHAIRRNAHGERIDEPAVLRSLPQNLYSRFLR
ncbi:hypothetical protein B0A48_13287 [Cryoendolithus antarcticus]|uniref:DUF7923 domain-containing protein n=1 Tax=Cryoendolithus antarcticus TaxID=1507870 RepID=A0A1V8SPR9_9PEZI|nr:hypothetical protein B0A48_13287 [Cryoendolithus antarcticus]